MFVIHDQTLIKQLETIAEQKGAQIEDVLREMVAAYHPSEGQSEPDLASGMVPGSWEWINAHLDEVTFSTGNPLTVEEIQHTLDEEFADYLFSRMNNGVTPDSH
jgi:hypothetical protein